MLGNTDSCGRLHVVEGGEVPEAGQGHDERPSLGAAERAEVGADVQDLGLARGDEQRWLSGDDPRGATSVTVWGR
jgi:hypothetical protein